MKNIKKIIYGTLILLMVLVSGGSLWATVSEDAIAAASFFKKYNAAQIVLIHLKDATNKYDKLNTENDLANTILIRELYLFYYGGYEKIFVGVGENPRNKAAVADSDINSQFKALANYAGMIDKGEIMNEEQFRESLEHLSKLDVALHKYIQDLGL